MCVHVCRINSNELFSPGGNYFQQLPSSRRGKGIFPARQEPGDTEKRESRTLNSREESFLPFASSLSRSSSRSCPGVSRVQYGARFFSPVRLRQMGITRERAPYPFRFLERVPCPSLTRDKMSRRIATRLAVRWKERAVGNAAFVDRPRTFREVQACSRAAKS